MLVLSRIRLRPPATRSALEKMAVVEQPVQHGNEGGAVPEQFVNAWPGWETVLVNGHTLAL
jgi:hypothetical protein